MLKELLNKRFFEYESSTKKILELYSEKMIKALRLYSKTDKDIDLVNIDFYSTNQNFLTIHLTIALEVGDSLRAVDNEIITITEENHNKFKKDVIQLILPISVVEEGTSLEIYESIKEIDNFLAKYGVQSFQKCLNAGIHNIKDLTYKDEYIELLDELTNPIVDIIKTFDDLQKVQYMLFSKDIPKVLN